MKIMGNLFTLQVAAAQTGAAHAELDPWQLVMEASPVVKLVMLVLVVMSVACWFIVGAKLVRLANAARRSSRFLDFFWGSDRGPQWSPERLEGVYAQVGAFEGSPIAALFRAGYVELARVASGGQSEGIDNIDRALRRAAGTQMTSLESLLPFLGTTASAAPFIGLFGTVWGIMNSFIAIGGQKSATLDVVAPGIAEALIATAIGLAAAIPAVMAYNYFVRRIRVLENEMESFASDYLNIVRRHFLRG